MTINQKNWGKAILSSYNHLQRLCSSIDDLIETTAVNSYYSYSSKHSHDSVTDISNKIIKLSNRKIDYINLKILIEKALKEIPSTFSKLLILRFIHKVHIIKVCDVLNISKRASYRKLDRALSSFMAKLANYGFNVEKLEIEFFGDPFISSIYRIVESSNFVMDEKAEVLTNDSFFKKYINELMASTI